MKREGELEAPGAREKTTSFDLSVFQLSAPFGAWSLLRKWSCPADSEVSAEVSGALNFILCTRIILHYAVRHNFTVACRSFTFDGIQDFALISWRNHYIFIRAYSELIAQRATKRLRTISLKTQDFCIDSAYMFVLNMVHTVPPMEFKSI